MKNFSAIGEKRYKLLKPLYVENIDTTGVINSSELYDKVREILKELMCEQKQVCTYFGFTTKRDELENADSGFYSYHIVEDYSYEQLLERFNREIVRNKLTGISLRFETYYGAADDKWFIIVCN